MEGVVAACTLSAVVINNANDMINIEINKAESFITIFGLSITVNLLYPCMYYFK